MDGVTLGKGKKRGGIGTKRGGPDWWPCFGLLLEGGGVGGACA